MQPNIADEAAAGPSTSNAFLPVWPPAGSLGSGHLIGSAHMGGSNGGVAQMMMMGMSPGMDSLNFCKSLDMADMCSHLMQGGEPRAIPPLPYCLA